MLVSQSETAFVPAAFESERELELVVEHHAELLFGAYSIYLPQQRVATHGGYATIPDAIAIDLSGRSWHVVEVELARHGTWNHIAPQVSKQLTAVQNDQTRERVIDQAIGSVAQSARMSEVLDELGVAREALHGRLRDILRGTPAVAIPIDEIAPDLAEWALTLRHQVKIWPISKFVAVGSEEKLYLLPEEATSTAAPVTAAESSASSSGPGYGFKDLVTAGILRNGQPLFMEYGPRGMPRQRFESVVRPEGLEIDGQVYSPSYAAVLCMRRAGSERQTANGWKHWKTEAGTLIFDLEFPPELRSRGTV